MLRNRAEKENASRNRSQPGTDRDDFPPHQQRDCAIVGRLHQVENVELLLRAVAVQTLLDEKAAQQWSQKHRHGKRAGQSNRHADRQRPDKLPGRAGKRDQWQE